MVDCNLPVRAFCSIQAPVVGFTYCGARNVVLVMPYLQHKLQLYAAWVIYSQVNSWITIVNHSLVALIGLTKLRISCHALTWAGEMCRVRHVPNKSTSLEGLLVFKNLDSTYDHLLGKWGRMPDQILLDRKGLTYLLHVCTQMFLTNKGCHLN